MAESSKPDNTYRLVLFDTPDEPEKVRDLICGVTGAHPTDAMYWVAHAPGIVRQPLAEGEVRELLDGLFELGVPAEAWRVDALPNLYPPRTVHQVACLDEGFKVQGLRGEPTHWVPWDRIELIAAGRVVQEDEQRDIVPPGWVQAAATGLNMLLRRRQAVLRRPRSLRLSRDPVGEALLVRRDPRIAFRVVETQMNYAYLGERLQASAGENFPIFLADLCQRAASAYLPQSTRAFLEGGDPDSYTFETPQALLDYATHRLLWSWYRRDRDAAQSNESS